jgi:hypothetical protein
MEVWSIIQESLRIIRITTDLKQEDLSIVWRLVFPIFSSSSTRLHWQIFTRLLITPRAGIQFTQKRKLNFLHTGNDLCGCGKVGSLKHMISCCPQRAGLMTKRYNNVGRIIVQAIELNNQRILSNAQSFTR